MEWLNEIAQNRDTPVLAAFVLGLLTAIAPCPLATNVTATAKNIAFSMEKLGLCFKAITKLEKIMRIAAGIVFILTGLYYINIYFKII